MNSCLHWGLQIFCELFDSKGWSKDSANRNPSYVVGRKSYAGPGGLAKIAFFPQIWRVNAVSWPGPQIACSSGFRERPATSDGRRFRQPITKSKRQGRPPAVFLRII